MFSYQLLLVGEDRDGVASDRPAGDLAHPRDDVRLKDPIPCESDESFEKIGALKHNDSKGLVGLFTTWVPFGAG